MVIGKEGGGGGVLEEEAGSDSEQFEQEVGRDGRY